MTTTWLVTGASRGLGFAVAEMLLQEGAQVVFCARQPDEVKRAETLLAHSGSVLAMTGSIEHPPFVEQMIAAAITEFGGLDGIVANAAVLPTPPLSAVQALEPRELQQVFAINVFGMLHILRAAHPTLQRSPRPRILAITSDAAHARYPGWSAYAMSKAALEELVLSYAAENPRVTSCVVDPGDMDTRMHHQALPEDPAPLRNPQDMSRAIRPLVVGDAWPTGQYQIVSDRNAWHIEEVGSHA